jgi:quercetin dioxygenase-like cupin family protein
MPVRVEHWNPGWGPLNEANMRRRLQDEGYAVQRYHYPPGTYFSEHTHDIDKKDTVLAGRLEIGTEQGTVVLEAGDMIEIPAGMPHTAEVIGGETVISLDATRVAKQHGR